MTSTTRMRAQGFPCVASDWDRGRAPEGYPNAQLVTVACPARRVEASRGGARGPGVLELEYLAHGDMDAWGRARRRVRAVRPPLGTLVPHASER